MAFVRVEQRNGRLAGPVQVDLVNGRDGETARGIVTVISNTRRGTGQSRDEEATAIQWTLWGAQAQNAARYLGKGSRVNVIGHVRNHHYTAADGSTVYAFDFTCEELDYLDSKAEAEARRARQDWVGEYDGAQPPQAPAAAARPTPRQSRSTVQ